MQTTHPPLTEKQVQIPSAAAHRRAPVRVLYAFDGCTALKTLVLPNTASDIWDYAFNHCASLENLTFGFGMSEIGDVFYDTEKLANVYFYGTQEQWDNIIMWHLTGYLEEATVHIMGNQ